MASGKETQNQQQKDNRQLSLSRKLAFAEIWRRFWLLFGTNILIVILFFAGLIAYAEITVREPASQGSYYVTQDIGEPMGIGFSWPEFLGDRLGGVDIRRYVWSDDIVAFSGPQSFLEGLKSFRYMIQVSPEDVEPVSYAVFAYPAAITVFAYCFGVLLLLELLGLLGDWHDISKSIRKTLRPIYDLTVAAKSMNMTAKPVMPLKAAPNADFTGAIATLNNIDEKDLGRRIIITDERAELKGLAEAINAMLDRLDAAYSSQLRFVSDASHELRTPIAVIQGYSNLLDRWGKIDEKTLQESIDAIKTEAAGMQDLVEQLLFLARSDNQSITLSVEVVDAAALADEVFRETQMIDKSHEYTLRLDEGEFPVRGDAQLLKQALRIFVDNAIKYTPADGRVTISLTAANGYVQLSVTDTGIGIPAKDLPRIFDRFFRADESRARGTGGTGLGLSISKWIIDRHGGFVEIVSREDFGTKITAALPCYTPEPEPAPMPESASPATPPPPARLPESL
jgi:signal transduction histidine kinase